MTAKYWSCRDHPKRKETVMPMVGSKKFPCSKKGFADAKKASKKTGTKMSFASKNEKKKSAMNGGYRRA
tara:strand:+ start:186 stop:392 length:207 start_codon:yes stop_codon:yes gene_type:complete